MALAVQTPPAREPALVLKAVNKVYNPRGKKPVHAVRNLDMTIGRGEIIALLGSSGCGKTSTLRMIAGFEDVSEGSIDLAGRRIDLLAPSRRRVAMAFEGYSLYPPLTVRDNIAFALKAQNLPKAAVDKKLATITDLLEIGPMLERYPSSISGGQQQRASLARALVREADLYLLDEPMSQLEPQLRGVLRGRVKRFITENTMTAVFVTHDQTEANALADRIAVMEGGVLQQMASPAELKARPANLFVATFVGEPPMNVFDAVLAAPDRLRLEGVEGQPGFELTLPRPLDGAAGRKLVFGIRPHDIAVQQGGIAGGLPAEVVSVQWLGDQTHVACQLAGVLTVAVSFDRLSARIGDRLPLAIDAAHGHVFDRETGRALLHGAEIVR